MSSTDITKVETDQKEAILRIAEANNVIREKEVTISELTAREDSLKAEVAKYEQAKQEVAKENATLAAELEKTRTAIDKQKNALNDSFDTREKELTDREEALALREKELADMEVSYTKQKAELVTINEESAKADSEVTSKLESIKRLKAVRDSEIAELEAKRVEAETECKKLEVLREKVENESEQVKKLRARNIESEKNAIELSESITAERQALEVTRLSALNESSCAEYNKAQALHLVHVFRQALHSYVQLSGTGIQIPELTDEHKEFIAKDLLKQIGKEIPESEGSVKTEEKTTDSKVVNSTDSTPEDIKTSETEKDSKEAPKK